ncbi:hypothetical protein F0L68_30565 [Solihabitans fulvus]|uniref:Peptidase inhibitor family I36 n=1 Tax=Solihabitans fulvus TaxID=1892852 RepID=A0A5B2WS58_9PSEU|nr:hypothetical protein [Solihabitans fulvus]KAA2254521.1 hypothetical protein F0L68_30565 [Solihabitans fulvus]
MQTKSKAFKRTVTAVATFALLGVGSIVGAGAANASTTTCLYNGCVTGTIPSNGNHQVCFGGWNEALADWGTTELWDLDTATRVGVVDTNGWGWTTKCVGGLYGANYYGVGKGPGVHVKVWN